MRYGHIQKDPQGGNRGSLFIAIKNNECQTPRLQGANLRPSYICFYPVGPESLRLSGILITTQRVEPVVFRHPALNLTFPDPKRPGSQPHIPAIFKKLNAVNHVVKSQRTYPALLIFHFCLIGTYLIAFTLLPCCPVALLPLRFSAQVLVVGRGRNLGHFDESPCISIVGIARVSKLLVC